MIDGGHVRALAKKAGRPLYPDYIELLAHACFAPGEHCHRILFYDCAPFQGTARRPISGTVIEFSGSDEWLRTLAAKPLFAVRRGVLKFRGFKPVRIPLDGEVLSDADFRPDFEQKGVDVRIGLDIANVAATGVVERIILLSGDTDCVPAMKHARTNGLQVILATLSNQRVADELLWHADFDRRVEWPGEA
jgi:uncharacterized LabA/DUF88 family protein